jgi:hypothetical protein
MNRRAAVGALGDRIEGSRSGEAERLRCTKPNNSFNRTRLEAAFHHLFDLRFCSIRSPVNSGVMPLTLSGNYIEVIRYGYKVV